MPVKKSVQKRGALQVTPARMWRRPAGELVPLPSGNVARLKRVTLEEIAITGALPDVLSGLINEVIQATIERKDITTAQWEQEWAKRAEQQVDFAEMTRMVNALTPVIFLEPVVVMGKPDYDAGQVALEDVQYMDRQAAFVWALGEVGLLVNLFPQPAGGVSALPGVQGVRG